MGVVCFDNRLCSQGLKPGGSDVVRLSLVLSFYRNVYDIPAICSSLSYTKDTQMIPNREKH